MNSPSDDHVTWDAQLVVDVRDAVFAARTYLEHRDVRRILSELTGARKLERACEFGAGFGRMTPILTEFASSVTGFEREPAFVDQARVLFPTISFERVESLERVPAPDHAFDLVLTFTVLQHLVDIVLASVAREIQRVLRPNGVLLICEETDVTHRAGDLVSPNGMCTIGRDVSTYAAVFSSLTLVSTRPRVIEPTYPRADVGAYMVFRRA